MYREVSNAPEVFLVHPGGPFWQHKDEGAWSIPKGEVVDGQEELLQTAEREFKEETGFTPSGPFIFLGTVKNKSGKTVHAWGFEGTCNPLNLKSNTLTIEWPPGSGHRIEIPEVDRGDFFTLDSARKKIVPYQVPLLDSLERHVGTA